MRIIMDDASIEQVNFVHGDITDEVRFEEVVASRASPTSCTWAALQVPFVREPGARRQSERGRHRDRFRNRAQARRSGPGLAYASSIAVYGSANLYPPGPLADDAPLIPVTLYGVTKRPTRAGRPSTGRITRCPAWVCAHSSSTVRAATRASSTPTKAMAAAAMGRPTPSPSAAPTPTSMPDDVARVFIQAARTMPAGAPVYNLGGTVASVADVVSRYRTRGAGERGHHRFNEEPLFTPDGVEGKAVEELLGPIAWRPLDQGVRDTIRGPHRRQRRPVRRRAGDCLSAAAAEGRMRLRNIFAASRFVIGLAVLGSFVGSAILLVIATITLFSIAWNEIVNFDPDTQGDGHIDRLGVELIEITDIILLGTVLYIVALGLYQLFIDQNLALPRWLKERSDRPETGPHRVVVVLLGVSFLGEVVNWEGRAMCSHSAPRSRWSSPRSGSSSG